MSQSEIFTIETTTGDLLLDCERIILYRCPLCMEMYTLPVIPDHLKNQHKLKVR